MTLTWRVGGRHKNKSINQNIYANLNPKTEKIVEIIKGKCDSCRRNKSQFITH